MLSYYLVTELKTILENQISREIYLNNLFEKNLNILNIRYFENYKSLHTIPLNNDRYLILTLVNIVAHTNLDFII